MDVAEPTYQCSECFKVMPMSEALQHNIDSGHRIKRIVDKDNNDA